ncbi:gastrula zinc finger protein XlCGF52.1-like isoform X1 [Entelurus aequoreus]|uniref:gastrula zinc finger protein XlCGF52.1-like isoform X1 n=1 Tax=Entelurus aequoreus TaxID=161455 RepID=UPI002B1DE31E|nr:gastrula zinc finger protein XlCGF52.1-like isoform X1 [Entelurus aequoreus]
MDDYCYAKMATNAKREHEGESTPPTSSKSPTEIKTKSADKDVEQPIGHPGELTPQPQGESSTLKEEDPHSPHIKEEEEDLCITLGAEEADLARLPLTIVSVKTEDDEEKPPETFRWSFSANVQQLIGHPEELPPHQQGGDFTWKQEASQPPHLKEEDEGGCLLGPEEADLTKLQLIVVSVKTEDDEEKAQVDNILAPLSDSEAEDEVEEPFSSDTDCKGDMRTHTDNTNSECSIENTTKKHLSCSVCAKSFMKKSNLIQHMRIHTGEKTFNCSVCGKSFTQKGNLSQHMKTHTGEKTFNCSVCSKSFSLKCNLTQHMRMHTGEKPFNCSVCGKNFSMKGSLTVHMRTHTGEKPFDCSVCSKSFFRKGSLTQHMKKHTGEKLIYCSICGKSFITNSHLTEHMRKHTGEKPFICSVCGKSYTQRSNLSDHMRTHRRNICQLFS